MKTLEPKRVTPEYLRENWAVFSDQELAIIKEAEESSMDIRAYFLSTPFGRYIQHLELYNEE